MIGRPAAGRRLSCVERDLGPLDPARRRVGALSQKKVELGGVVLQVAHAVQRQLGKAQIERSPLAPLARFLLGQCHDRRAAFLAAVSQIRADFVLGIRAFREGTEDKRARFRSCGTENLFYPLCTGQYRGDVALATHERTNANA